MTDWIKNIISYPFQYTLQQLNLLSLASITMFFNTYGNKFLKIETDVIDRSECIDDSDIFYLCPIQLKNNVFYDLGANSIMIESGTIHGIIVRFPWQSILSEPTHVTIESIDINISIEKKISPDMSLLVNSLINSVLIENTDITDIKYDINELITTYVDKINVKINSVIITVKNCFKIILTNITYNNSKLKISEIKFVSDIQLCLIKNISLERKELHIESILLNSLFFDKMPVLVITSNNSEPINLIIQLDLLNIDDKIHIHNILLKIIPDNIIIEQIGKIDIPDIITITHSPGIIHYNQCTNICDLNATWDIQLISYDKLTKLRILFEPLTHKILSDSPENNINKVFCLKNVNMILRNINSQSFHINISQIIYSHQNCYITCTDLKIIDTYSEVEINTSKLEHSADKIIFSDIIVRSPTFSGTGQKIIVDMTGIIIALNGVHLKEIYLGIKYGISVYEILFESPTKSTAAVSTSKVHLSVTDSSFFVENLKICIISGSACITDKVAEKVILEIKLDEVVIGKGIIDKLTTEQIIISKCDIYIDPEIFDQLNYLCGTLIPNASETDAIDQIIMKQSVEATSVDHLELVINEFIKSSISVRHIIDPTIINPTVKLLLESNFTRIQSIIMDDYQLSDFNNYLIKIFIKSVNIYLYDELESSDGITNAFLCVVLNNCNFYKSSVVNTAKNNNVEIRYNLQIDQGGIIDIQSKNAEWKYFTKQTYKDILFEVDVYVHNHIYRIDVKICPLTVNIREETLLHILSFFSNSHQVPKSTSSTNAFVEKFSIKSVGLVVNYFPLILKENISGDILTLKNFKIVLHEQCLKNIDGFDILISHITTKWKRDINPDNIIQFIPNLKIIQPYTVMISRFIKITTKYFGQTHNKRKIRTITKNINRGVSMVTSIIRLGLNQVIDLFD